MMLYKLAVFIRPGIMTPAICRSWQDQGCELLVRSDYPPLEEAVDQNYAGALLDIKLRASYLFDLSELLTVKNLPHVFIVADAPPASHYALNGDAECIRSILDELLYQDDSGYRH